MTATHTSDTHGMRPRRVLVGLSLTAAMGILALTGCASGRHPSRTALPGADGSPAVTAMPAPSSTAAPPPGAAGATAGPVAPSGATAKAPARGPAPACPVATDTLVSALKASSTDLYKRAGRPTALQDASCYGTFAVAQTVSDGWTQVSSVLFGFDAGSRTWRALNIGSADFCAGYVPADIAAHLPGCG